MSKTDVLVVQGRILEALPSSTFRVELETGQTILAHLAGRMRIHYVRIVPGDTVQVEISPYDLKNGRITYRLKHEAA
jgi:translation initiation factor IF-1